MPLRNAQAKLAVLDDYREREELGALQADASAAFNPSGSSCSASRRRSRPSSAEPPTTSSGTRRRSRSRCASSSARSPQRARPPTTRGRRLRDRWFDRLLGPERDDVPLVVPRRVHAPAVAARDDVHEGARRRGLHGDAARARLRHGERREHPARPRRPAAEVAARLRDRIRSAEGRAPDHARAGRPARLPGVPARGRARAALRGLRSVALVHVPPALARPRADRDLLVHPRVDHARARVARRALRPRRTSRRPRTRTRRSSSRRCSSGATSRSCSTSSTSGRATTTSAGRPRDTPTGSRRRSGCATARTRSCPTWMRASTPPTTCARGSARRSCARTCGARSATTGGATPRPATACARSSSKGTRPSSEEIARPPRLRAARHVSARSRADRIAA